MPSFAINRLWCNQSKVLEKSVIRAWNAPPLSTLAVHFFIIHALFIPEAFSIIIFAIKVIDSLTYILQFALNSSQQMYHAFAIAVKIMTNYKLFLVNCTCHSYAYLTTVAIIFKWYNRYFWGDRVLASTYSYSTSVLSEMNSWDQE